MSKKSINLTQIILNIKKDFTNIKKYVILLVGLMLSVAYGTAPFEKYSCVAFAFHPRIARFYGEKYYER